MNADPGTGSMHVVPELRDGLPVPRRYAAIISLSLGTILTTIDGSIVSVALPTIARDLHVTPSAAVLVVTIYQLVMMVALLPFSALGDRIGHRATYQFGQMLFVVATILCFFAPNLPLLVLVRGLQALGAAAALSVSAAMIRSVYPASRLGRGLSLNTIVAATAGSLAPTVGGAILLVARWPWLFAIIVPFGLLSILIGRKSLPEPHIRKEPFDMLGAAMCAVVFGLAITGLESAVEGARPIVAVSLLALSIVLGFAFVRRESGQERPVFPVDLLRRATIALPSIALLAAYLGLAIVMLVLPFRLQHDFHFTPAAAGALMAPWSMTALVVAPVSGLLSDRYPAGLLSAIGMAIGTIGLICLAFLPASPDHLDIAWRVSLSGLGFGMFFSPISRQVIAAAPIDRAASAGALTSAIRGAGQTLGATAVGAMLAMGIGTGPIPPLIAAGLAVVAGLCSLAVLRPATRHVPMESLLEL